MVLIKAVSEVQVIIKTMSKEIHQQSKLLTKILAKVDGYGATANVNIPQELTDTFPITNLSEMENIEKTLSENPGVNDALVSEIQIFNLETCWITNRRPCLLRCASAIAQHHTWL